MLDRPHSIAAEGLRERALHDATTGQHIADAAGNAQIVFQYDIVAIVQAQQIGARDRDVDITRAPAAHAFRDESADSYKQFRGEQSRRAEFFHRYTRRQETGSTR